MLNCYYLQMHWLCTGFSWFRRSLQHGNNADIMSACVTETNGLGIDFHWRIYANHFLAPWSPFRCPYMNWSLYISAAADSICHGITQFFQNNNKDQQRTTMIFFKISNLQSKWLNMLENAFRIVKYASGGCHFQFIPQSIDDRHLKVYVDYLWGKDVIVHNGRPLN